MRTAILIIAPTMVHADTVLDEFMLKGLDRAAIEDLNRELELERGAMAVPIDLSPDGRLALLQLKLRYEGLLARDVMRLGTREIVAWYTVSAADGQIVRRHGEFRPSHAWWDHDLLNAMDPPWGTVWGDARRDGGPDGRLHSVEYIREGRRNGPSRSFLPDGRTTREEWFRNGVREGSFRLTHPDGTPFVQGEFRNGASAGRWQFFDPAGRPVSMRRLSRTFSGGAWFQLNHPSGGMLHFLQRPGDDRPALIYGPGNAVTGIALDRSRRKVMVEQHLCSDCPPEYAIFDLRTQTGTRYWGSDGLEMFRRWNSEGSGTGGKWTRPRTQ